MLVVVLGIVIWYIHWREGLMIPLLLGIIQILTGSFFLYIGYFLIMKVDD